MFAKQKNKNAPQKSKKTTKKKGNSHQLIWRKD